MAQVGSSLENKVTPEDARPYPMTAASVGRNGGRLKGKPRIVTRTPQKVCIQDSAAKRRPRGTPSPKPRAPNQGINSKHVLQNCIQQTLTNLRGKVTAKLV
jgi:hypothetical protein